MAKDLDETIRDNASAPKRAASDGVSVEQQSLPDQIATDKYLESKKASRTKGLGVKLAKISPGGTA